MQEKSEVEIKDNVEFKDSAPEEGVFKRKKKRRIYKRKKAESTVNATESTEEPEMKDIIEDAFDEVKKKADETFVTKPKDFFVKEEVEVVESSNEGNTEEPSELTPEEMKEQKVKKLGKFLKRYRDDTASDS